MGHVVGVVVLVAAILVCANWMLGHTETVDSGPIGVAWQKAYDQLCEWIGKLDIAVQKARRDYQNAVEVCSHARKDLAEAQGRAALTDQKVEKARAQLKVLEDEVEAIAKAVQNGQTIRFIDGSVASMKQVSQRLEILKAKVELARFKVKELESLAATHHAALAEREKTLREAPDKLAALKSQLEICQERLAVYRELQSLYGDSKSAPSDNFVAALNQARESASKADESLRVALAGVGGLQTGSLVDQPLTTEKVEVTADSILNQIDSIRKSQGMVIAQ